MENIEKEVERFKKLTSIDIPILPDRDLVVLQCCINCDCAASQEEDANDPSSCM